MSDVTTDHKRRAHHAPKGEMGLILGIGANILAPTDPVVIAAVVHSYHQHIHVVVTEGAGEGLFVHLGKSQTFDGFPVVLYISGGTIGVGTGFANPVIHIILTPVAGGKQNIPAAVL